MTARGHFDENGFWVDDPPDAETDSQGLALAKLITEWAEADGGSGGSKVTLNGPAQFTATGRRGAATVATLIGMEEFKLRGAYLANKKDLVLTLAPASAEKFQFIEVPVGEALEKFEGMRTLLDRIFARDTIEALAAMRKAQIVAQEQQRVQEKAELYDDNFGAW